MAKSALFTFSSLGVFAFVVSACGSSDSSAIFDGGGAGGIAATGGSAVTSAGTNGAIAGGGNTGTTSGGSTSLAGSSAGGASNGGAGGTVASSGNAGVGGVVNGGASNGGAGAGGSASGEFSLTSPDFSDGSAIPVAATCATTNPMPAMPALNWSGVPAGTKSFALTFLDDTRLPSPQGMHYAMWDIPAEVMSLPENLAAGSPPAGVANLAGAKQKNPFAARYLGPCPNNTDGSSDTYAFTLYALSQEQLPGSVTDVASVVSAIQAANPLGKAVLTGTSDAKGTLR